MSSRLAAARGSLGLAARFPLHLAAAYAAALIAEILLTMQPLFLRAFIDGAQAGLDKRALWQFPAFMLAAAALTYAFDSIAAGIRFLLQNRLELELKEVYLEHGDLRQPEAARFALRAGIGKLSQLALSIALDVLLVFSRIALILGFVSLDDAALSGLALGALAVGAAVTAATTTRLGRLSRLIERAGAGAYALSRRAGAAAAEARLARVAGWQGAQYLLRSTNVLVTFLIFRLLPVVVLSWYLLDRGLTLGALASTFLYFSMLRGPYHELSAMIQESLVSLSESALFQSELARGLALRRLLTALPKGMIWDRAGAARGTPLSAAERAEGEPREFFDDLAPGPAKDAALDRLRLRSKRRSLCLHSSDPEVARFAHFVRRGPETAGTVLAA